MSAASDSLAWARYDPGALCPQCKQPRTPEGHDPCLGTLPGVSFACCGHGGKGGYIAFENGTAIYFQASAVVHDGPPRRMVVISNGDRPADDPQEAVPMCDGDWMLGSACRKCSRCKDGAMRLLAPILDRERQLREYFESRAPFYAACDDLRKNTCGIEDAIKRVVAIGGKFELEDNTLTLGFDGEAIFFRINECRP